MRVPVIQTPLPPFQPARYTHSNDMKYILDTDKH